MKILYTSDIHYGNGPKTIFEAFFEKISKEEFDVLVVGGDIASTKPSELSDCLKGLVKAAGNRPVLVVRGNHDFWDSDGKCKSIESMDLVTRRAIKNAGAHYLPDGKVDMGEVVFIGWDGWYTGHLPGRTNDFNYMPKSRKKDEDENGSLYYYRKSSASGHLWAKVNEVKQFHDALFDARSSRSRIDRPTIVAVTHFPISYAGAYGYKGTDKEFNADFGKMDEIGNYIDILCVGHSHTKCDGELVEVKGSFGLVNYVSVWNSGSDYRRPAYVIIDTEEERLKITEKYDEE